MDLSRLGKAQYQSADPSFRGRGQVSTAAQDLGVRNSTSLDYLRACLRQEVNLRVRASKNP